MHSEWMRKAPKLKGFEGPSVRVDALVGASVTTSISVVILTWFLTQFNACFSYNSVTSMCLLVIMFFDFVHTLRWKYTMFNISVLVSECKLKFVSHTFLYTSSWKLHRFWGYESGYESGYRSGHERGHLFKATNAETSRLSGEIQVNPSETKWVQMSPSFLDSLLGKGCG